MKDRGQCDNETEAAMMSEDILRSLGYTDVNKGRSKLDINLLVSDQNLRVIAKNAERIGRWARKEIKRRVR